MQKGELRSEVTMISAIESFFSTHLVAFHVELVKGRPDLPLTSIIAIVEIMTQLAGLLKDAKT